MQTITLETPISALGPTAKRRTKEIEGLGLVTVRDLLLHFPSRHEDFSAGTPLADVEPGMSLSLVAQVLKAKSRPRFAGRMALTEALISDGESELQAVWFNQPYRAKSLVPGKSFRFIGKVSKSKFGMQLQNPSVEPVATGEGILNFAGSSLDPTNKRLQTPNAAVPNDSVLIPVYSTTAGVSQQVLRLLVRKALPVAAQLEDPMPPAVVAKYGLLPFGAAVRAMHDPTDANEAAAARRRIGFDEMFRMQLSIGKMRRLRQAKHAPVVPYNATAAATLKKGLSFDFTADQRAAVTEIINDMKSGHQMHRLLDGDVGSGKTVVAAVAMMNAAIAGMQAAMMAPTEILAFQHFKTLAKLYKDQPFTTAIWTQSYKRAVRDGKEISCDNASEVRALGEDIAAGNVGVVVGTQALIEDTLAFHSLALAVVDEQHRFGVRMRSWLVGKSGTPGMEPHLLSMTATPIPRTLALAMFGDLDLSLLKSKPAGRQEVETRLVPSKERSTAYSAVRAEIAEGRQAFVVCPLIDPSDKLGLASVSETFESLRKKELKGLKLAMLHGKLKAEEKEKIMRDFLAKRLQVLVATSVIEVGVDIPNATVMCIEGAERFGLSQLHQFRGRIGRGEHKSYCFLMPGSLSHSVRARLQAVVSHADGFSLAEKDLLLRGPGDVLGTAQSGFPEFLLASFADAQLIDEAKRAAELLLNDDPELASHPALLQGLRAMAERAHLE